MPLLDMDLSTVKDEDMGGGSWRALPDGEYLFHCIASDYRETRAKTGMVLELEWECIEPNFRGKVWDYLTLEHPNEETTRIARARLKEVALAVGHENPDYVKSSEELHMKPCMVKVSRVKAKEARWGDGEGYQNRIVGYRKIGSGSATLNSDEPPAPSDDDIPF